MSFLKELNKTIGENKTFGQDQASMMHSTGFDCFDYLNASRRVNETTGEEEYLKGIGAGRLVMVIGKSGSGKSTFAIQMAHNIIKPYDESSLFILDFEQSNTEERIRRVTGMSKEYYNEHVMMKKVGISTETVLAMANEISRMKKEHEKELLIENKEGLKDPEGKIIKILPPTVILIDSIPMMQAKAALDNVEMEGQMAVTANARYNAQLFRKLSQVCASGNIICIFINHINQKIDTGVVPTQAQVNFLSQDESLPGGNACIFLTDTLIRITTASKLDEEKTYGIKGFMTKISLVKSRNSAAGRSIPMVYNQREGFDNTLSLLEYIKACGKLKGAGVSYKLEGLEDHVFRLSNFKQKLEQDEVLNQYFYQMATDLLKESVK